MRWVRPTIAFAFTGTIIYGFLIGKVDAKFLEAMAAGSIGWFFWARDKEKAKLKP